MPNMTHARAECDGVVVWEFFYYRRLDDHEVESLILLLQGEAARYKGETRIRVVRRIPPSWKCFIVTPPPPPPPPWPTP